MKKISFLFSMILLISAISLTANAGEKNLGPVQNSSIPVYVNLNNLPVNVTQVHLRVENTVTNTTSYYSKPYNPGCTVFAVQGNDNYIITPSVTAFYMPGISFDVTPYYGSLPHIFYLTEVRVDFHK